MSHRHGCALVALSLLAACSPRPDELAREAAELRGDCTVEGLRHADDACVEAFARGTQRLEDAMEVYAGALRTLQRLADERGMVLDTSFVGAMPFSMPHEGDAAAGPVWDFEPPSGQRRLPTSLPDPREQSGPPRGYVQDPRHSWPDERWEASPPVRGQPPSSYESLAERRAAAYEEMLARRGALSQRADRDPAPARATPDYRLDQFDRYAEPGRHAEPGRYPDVGRYPQGSFAPGSYGYPPTADPRSDRPDCRRLELELRRSLAGNAPIDIHEVAALVRMLENWCTQSQRPGTPFRGPGG